MRCVDLIFKKMPHGVSLVWLVYLGYNTYKYGYPEAQSLISVSSIYVMQVLLAVFSLFIFSQSCGNRNEGRSVSVGDFLALSSFIAFVGVGKIYPDTAHAYFENGIASISIFIAVVNLVLVKSAFR